MTSETWVALTVGGVSIICSVAPQLLIHGYYRGKEKGKIDELTTASEEAKDVQKDHEVRLQDHDVRLTRVEAVCELRHGGRNVQFPQGD